MSALEPAVASGAQDHHALQSPVSGKRRRRLLAPLAVVPCLALALSACTPAVDVASAKDSTNPACSPMMVALPDTLADAPLRATTSQATAAWGNPSLVILRCGVNPPGPTTDVCVSVKGVDWVIKEGNPSWTLTSYGRIPATEIVLDPNKIASNTVLVELANAVGKIPQTRHCVGPSDVATPLPP
ncbi:MAG: DUF3515 domain-containing protein [Actinomycetota bacterium]|nr:DUF3515 domain-containing protein [Actinomycetota bacterium]